MKKMLFWVIIPLLFMSCEKEEILPENDIPAEIISYTTTHFPDNPIIQAVKDTDGLEVQYDVILQGSYSLEFNRKLEVTEIEGISKLPDSTIPAEILSYVTVNYAENYIVAWELDDRNQQINLNNGLEIEFSMSGDFLRIDK